MKQITFIIKSKLTKKCLESINNQTIKNKDMEVITTLEKDSNYKDVSDALKHATGEYISVIDGNSVLDKDYAKEMLYLIKRQHGDIIVCDYYNKDKLKRHIKTFLPSDKTNMKMLLGLNSSIDNKLFRRGLIKNIEYKDELSFTYMAIRRAKRVVKLDKALIEINSKNYDYDIYKSIDEIKKDYGDKDYIYSLNIGTKFIIENMSNRNINIDDGYKYLEDNFKEYKSAVYFKMLNFKNRIIRKHKILMKIFR